MAPSKRWPGETVKLIGTVYQSASIGLASNTLGFGTVLQGSAETVELPISNLLAAGTYSDTLIAQIGGSSVTITPGHTGSQALTVNTSTDGTARRTDAGHLLHA